MRPWSKVRALCQRALENGPALLGSFALSAVKLGIKSIIFGGPAAFVGQWCDVQPSWKSIAFMMFCIIWSDCVFDSNEDRSGRSAEPADPSTAKNQKAAAAVLTPAEVAAEARKLSREPKLVDNPKNRPLNMLCR